ncbi:MAG: hypothetical protein KKF46_06525 [Nanoarchaeota archaeon]|nr:hypothetical protein [Nanoarchaeota archaeon]MBU1321984.1 hypothetical protein [Nanoarchaeota archaeon]MBU1597637.1 hypothetical protein [Nanoarchaeota archaeon]MBU2442040.1 hypothetical protein [Nanoarchaeota archaeon]
MGLRHNKKGIVFTILSIVIAIFFTITFSARTEKPLDYHVDITNARITVIHSYTENFFDYAELSSSISGYSALQGVIEDLNNMNAYNPDFETQYVNCVETGMLTDSKVCPNMINKTLYYYLNKIKNLTQQEFNLESSYEIRNISVNQTKPFSIELRMNITLNITDAYANASDTRILTSSVDINGLLDPVYLINGTYNQTINQTSLRRAGKWNSTDLIQLYNNHEYREYNNATKFIDRIKGNFTPSNLGIESFVNHTHPDVSYDENDTMVDYLFWQGVKFNCQTPRVLEINDTSIINPFYQLDVDHIDSFDIDPSQTRVTC